MHIGYILLVLLPVLSLADSTGIVFQCNNASEYQKVKTEMAAFLEEQGLKDLVNVSANDSANKVGYELKWPVGSEPDTSILNTLPGLTLRNESVSYTNSEGKEFSADIVSFKEILAAMLVPGRTHEFKDKACSVKGLKEHLAVRQNVVLWAKHPKDWLFGSAKIHSQKYFTEDWDLKPQMDACDAVGSIFTLNEATRFGCRMACKMGVLQGEIDTFNKVAPDKEKLDLLKNYVAKPEWKESEIMDTHYNVPEKHWVPGDLGWVKNVNHSPSSSPGTQGANLISIGQGKFAGYWRSGMERNIDECKRMVRSWDGASKVSSVRDIPKIFDSMSPSVVLAQRNKLPLTSMLSMQEIAQATPANPSTPPSPSTPAVVESAPQISAPTASRPSSPSIAGHSETTHSSETGTSAPSRPVAEAPTSTGRATEVAVSESSRPALTNGIRSSVSPSLASAITPVSPRLTGRASGIFMEDHLLRREGGDLILYTCSSGNYEMSQCSRVSVAETSTIIPHLEKYSKEEIRKTIEEIKLESHRLFENLPEVKEHKAQIVQLKEKIEAAKKNLETTKYNATQMAKSLEEPLRLLASLVAAEEDAKSELAEDAKNEAIRAAFDRVQKLRLAKENEIKTAKENFRKEEQKVKDLTNSIVTFEKERAGHEASLVEIAGTDTGKSVNPRPNMESPRLHELEDRKSALEKMIREGFSKVLNKAGNSKLQFHVNDFSPVEAQVLSEIKNRIAAEGADRRDKIQTRSGIEFIKERTNRFGQGWRDPEGLIWGSIYGPFDSYREANDHCESLGGRLPTIIECKRLSNSFLLGESDLRKKSEWDRENERLILNPAGSEKPFWATDVYAAHFDFNTGKWAPLVYGQKHSYLARCVMERKEYVKSLIASLKEAKGEASYSTAREVRKITNEEAVANLPDLIDRMRDTPLKNYQDEMLKKMGDDVTAAVPILINGLSSEKSDIRQASASILADIGQKADSAVPELIKTLKDADSYTSQTAAYALSKMGPKAMAAVPELMKGLDDPNEYRRREFASRLGDMHVTSAIPKLVETWKKDPAERGENSEAYYYALALALAEMGEAGFPPLLELLASPNKRVSDGAANGIKMLAEGTPEAAPTLAAAVPPLKAKMMAGNWDAGHALAEIGSPALPALREAIKHQDKQIRWLAAKCLRDGHEAGVPLLVEALSDKDPGVREAAVEAFSYYPKKAVPIPKLIELLKDESRNVRYHAALALSRRGRTEDAIPQLIEGFPIDPNSAQELAKLGSKIIPLVKETLLDPNQARGEHYGAARTLALMGERGLPVLREGINHPNESIRNATRSALLKLGKKAEGVLPELEKGLAQESTKEGLRELLAAIGGKGLPLLVAELKKEKSWYPRMKLMESIGDMGDEGAPAVPILMENLASDDVSNRFAAVEALGKIGGSARQAIPELTKCLKDKDERVRARAQTSLDLIRRP